MIRQKKLIPSVSSNKANVTLKFNFHHFVNFSLTFEQSKTINLDIKSCVSQLKL